VASNNAWKKKSQERKLASSNKFSRVSYAGELQAASRLKTLTDLQRDPGRTFKKADKQ